MRRMLATEVHRRFISDCNGRNPRSGAASPLRRFGLALVPRLPVLGGYPAGIPRLVAPCAGADCGDSFTGVDPPGFWFVLQGKDPNLPRLPVLGGYPAATPWFVPPCAGADCGDPPFRRRPPGSGLSCRKTGSNLTPFRGSGRLFRFLAAIRVDVYGITPGQKHSHRRCPVPQPTKPPRALLGRYVGPWTALKTA